MKKVLLYLAACFMPTLVFADVIVFNQNAVINSDYEAISIEGDAEVSITGGTIQKLYILDEATVNFSGGTVYELMCYDKCCLNISGNAKITRHEFQGHFAVYGNSIVTMNGGTVGFGAYFYNNSTLYYYDGLFEREETNFLSIEFYDYSNLFLYNGEPAPSNDKLFRIYLKNNAFGYMSGGVVASVDIEGNASFYMTGGKLKEWSSVTNHYVGDLVVGHNSKAYISGGVTQNIGIYSGSDYLTASDFTPFVHIFGNNLSMRPYGGEHESDGTLTGNWLNGTSFSMNIDYISYPNIQLHEGETPPDPFSDSQSLPSESALDLQVLIYNLRQGKTFGTDKLTISGRLNEPSNLELEGKTLVISCGSYLETITIPEGKNGVFRYKPEPGSTVSSAILDLSKGTFKATISNADLSDANPGEFNMQLY